MKQDSKIIDRFTGEWEEFSNFYPVVIHFNGLNFPSVEHAYVASKTKDSYLWRQVSLIPADEAGRAKKLGRRLKLRNDWGMVKISMMRQFLMQKFSYDHFRSKLSSTGDAMIIEGNYWHDNFWGDCFCKKCKNIEGKNNLGKLMMKIRGIVK